MNYLQQQVLVSRIKSFVWHMFGIGTVAALTWGLQEVSVLELTPTIESLVVIFLGEALAQTTKYFNVNKPWIKSQLP